jgi:Rps23 Pro-64 3,4-dihydroxylase Tpa1-like proline 4-hydroxylase
MNDLFEKNGFIVIKNFITKKRSKKLSKEFIEFCNENPDECNSDSQVPGTPAKYNYIPFLELLCEKTPEVSKILGETVLPTYTYSRVYKNSDILEKHTDRDECEISLTIHLDGDQEWSIYLEDLNGNPQSFNLKCGDALLYSGCVVPHWRDKYEGNYCNQVFLHYIRSRGSKSSCYFDRKKESYKDVKNYIKIFENIISDELCDRILSEYANSDQWSDSKIADGLHKNIRNCKIINISFDDIINQNQNIRKKIDDDIYSEVSKIISLLNKEYIQLKATQDSGYDLLKYEEDGFYTQHTDSFKEMNRAISCSLCLNDDYDGGEFAFFDRTLKYKLKKGSVITFPSNFMYPHEILPVTKGTRYSIITWFT